MTSRSLISTAAAVLLCTSTFAATPGSDFANDPAYDDGWVDGDDGGTPATFVPWGLQTTGTGTSGFVIETSTFLGGGANIDTDGEAFSLYAQGSDNRVDAFRTFGESLQPGQTFSLDLAVRFTDGDKGFSLRAGGTSIFNINVAGGGYAVNDVTTGGGAVLGTYDDNTVFSIQLTQTSETQGTWQVVRTGGISTSANGTYTGVPTNFQFYVAESGTTSANNLYFNNLAVTAIPEPSTVSLLAASAIFGACFYTRRRSR